MKNNETNRRTFIKTMSKASGALALTGLLPSFTSTSLNEKKFDFKISLAQWSLHKAFLAKQIDPLDFPVIAKKNYQIDTVEYVNQFFIDKAKDQNFLKQLKQRCDDHAVKSNLIMIDLEGSLADPDPAVGDKAVENHYKWVEAAAFLNCQAIRVNLHGTGTQDEWKAASIRNLGKLTVFAKTHHINVIVENHGGYSSNGKLLAEVIGKVNSPSCGTLPDFGNFCMKREKGDLWESPCIEFYDKYEGVKEMAPYAKGISAKTFDFDSNGNETTIDYLKMFRIVKDSGFTGYVGIEYEGERLGEEAGILATKALLEKVRTALA
jgi:sugar phosphate isomerase/epimerase